MLQRGCGQTKEGSFPRWKWLKSWASRPNCQFQFFIKLGARRGPLPCTHRLISRETSQSSLASARSKAAN